MTAQIIDGNAVAQRLKKQIAEKIGERMRNGQRVPCLAVILVGDTAASKVYVRNKKKACEETGIRSISYDLPTTTTEQEMLESN